jgi:DNA-binding response OmpR family regulator
MNQIRSGAVPDMLLRLAGPKDLPVWDALRDRPTNKSVRHPPTEPAALLLYVEDNILIHELMETGLRDAGFDVETVLSGHEAIAVLEAGPDRFRGVVTDVDLGAGPNGWDVARRARELTPGVPVVYVSGGSPGGWASEGVPQSVMLTKPFALQQVVVSISTLLSAARPTLQTTG